MPDLLFAADQGQRGAVGFLPALAESAGEVGGATHLALAYGLGARHPEDRTAAVDALLVLAAGAGWTVPRSGGSWPSWSTATW